jgi:hypothetical protein
MMDKTMLYFTVGLILWYIWSIYDTARLFKQTHQPIYFYGEIINLMMLVVLTNSFKLFLGETVNVVMLGILILWYSYYTFVDIKSGNKLWITIDILTYIWLEIQLLSIVWYEILGKHIERIEGKLMNSILIGLSTVIIIIAPIYFGFVLSYKRLKHVTK